MFQPTFLTQTPTIFICLIVLLLMQAFFYVGVRVRKKKSVKDASFDEKSFGAAEGALMGLLALMLAFSFSMSSGRHDTRINVIVQEANAIGTAVLRADLYPDSIRKAFRHDFKRYVESRIEFFEAGTDSARITHSLEQTNTIQQSLWQRAAKLGQDKENMHRTSQMIPALNDVIDIVTTRNAANMAKVPELIIYLLFVLCITAAFMIGYSVGKKPDWITMVIFGGMVAITIYLIVDLDRPRRGIITMKTANIQIVNLRSMFTAGE
jgi:hypothetical protein